MLLFKNLNNKIILVLPVWRVELQTYCSLLFNRRQSLYPLSYTGMLLSSKTSEICFWMLYDDKLICWLLKSRICMVSGSNTRNFRYRISSSKLMDLKTYALTNSANHAELLISENTHSFKGFAVWNRVCYHQNRHY